MKWIFFEILVLAISLGAWAGEIVYVQTLKATLLAEPKLASTRVAEVPRGTSLSVLKREGVWIQVSLNQKTGQMTGWISKLFIADHPPIGEAQLAAELGDDQNLGKAAHRRASSVSVSASTRGLVSGTRAREGRERFESDSNAIQKMESIHMNEKELRGFREGGKLNP